MTWYHCSIFLHTLVKSFTLFFTNSYMIFWEEIQMQVQKIHFQTHSTTEVCEFHKYTAYNVLIVWTFIVSREILHILGSSPSLFFSVLYCFLILFPHTFTNNWPNTNVFSVLSGKPGNLFDKNLKLPFLQQSLNIFFISPGLMWLK